MAKRGYQGKGYSLKWRKSGDRYLCYCYVWGEWDDITSKRQRALGSKNYSRSKGWTSLGNWEKPETHRKLREYLYFKYGHEEAGMQEIFDKINEEIEMHKETITN